MDNVACTGLETGLVNCTFDNHTGDCVHSEDAGVQCSSPPSTGECDLINLYTCIGSKNCPILSPTNTKTHYKTINVTVVQVVPMETSGLLALEHLRPEDE